MGGPLVGVDPGKNELVFAVLSPGGELLDDPLDTLSLSARLTIEVGLVDVKDRLLAHLLRLDASVLALSTSTKYAAWKLADLRPRAMLEAASMMAAAEAEVPVIEVSPHDSCKLFKCAHNKIADAVLDEFDLTSYSMKDRRAKAIAAAVYASKELE